MRLMGGCGRIRNMSFLRVLRVLRVFVVACLLSVQLACAVFAQQLNSASWGGDHVGKRAPEFMSGDECLFCHRDVGPGWPTNRHGQTIRAAEAGSPAVAALAELPRGKELAAEVELLMGGSVRQRFLKRSVEHGRLDLLSVEWSPSKSGMDGKLIEVEQPRWDSKTFAARCAGCHATAVDSAKQTFAAASLDCFVCHGEVPDKHTTEGRLVFLSPHRKDAAQVVTSICAQCHLRGGKSQSSGLPYSNGFVAGDNLFRDFRIDLSAVAIEALNPGDRHVQENVRDVVLLGKEGVTCLTCHDIHKESSRKHREVADGEGCRTCHVTGSKKDRVSYKVHSETCGY